MTMPRFWSVAILICLSWKVSTPFSLATAAATSNSNGNSMSMANMSPRILGKTIFLHSFQTVPHIGSMSPFTLKLESFLKIHDIPYELKEGLLFSSRGSIPFIMLNDDDDGDEISDSNVIIRQLQEELGDAHCDASLTPEQRAVSHMIIRMLEEHTSQILFHYRYGRHMDEFVEALDLANRLPPGFADKWKTIQPSRTLDKSKFRGLSRHDDDVLWSFSNDDIRCISDYLAEKPYFHGDEPTLVDCAIFGHLSQFFIPMDFPQKKFIEEECPNVAGLLDRFRARFWPELV